MREVRADARDALLDGERAETRKRGVRHEAPSIRRRRGERGEENSQALRQTRSGARVHAQVLREQFRDDGRGVEVFRVLETVAAAAKHELRERLGGGCAGTPLVLRLRRRRAAGDVDGIDGERRVFVQRREIIRHRLVHHGRERVRDGTRKQRVRRHDVFVFFAGTFAFFVRDAVELRVEAIGTEKQREVAERLRRDAPHRGRVRGERGAEHAHCLSLIVRDATHDPKQAENLDRLFAHRRARVRHARTHERRRHRLGGGGREGEARRAFQEKRHQKQSLRDAHVGVTLLQRIRGGHDHVHHLLGLARRAENSHERPLPGAVAASRVRRSRARDVEMRRVGVRRWFAQVLVDQVPRASPGGGVRQVQQREQRQELPGDEHSAGVGVRGDEIEQIRRRRGKRRLQRLEAFAGDGGGDELVLPDGGRRRGTALRRGGVQRFAHDAPVHGRLGCHQHGGVLAPRVAGLLRVAPETAAGGDAVRHRRRNLRGLDFADVNELLHRRLGDRLVALGVQRREKCEHVPLERQKPPLEHLHRRRAHGGRALGEPAANRRRAERDGHRRHRHFRGERQVRDSANVVRGVPGSLHDVRDGVVGDGERAQDGLAHLRLLLRAEQGEKRLRDLIVGEIAAVAAVLQTRQSSGGLRSHRRALVSQALQHHVLHALVQVIGDLSVRAERVEHAGDDLARAEPNSLVARAGEVEQEPEKRLGEIVSLILATLGARGGEAHQETHYALSAQVALSSVSGAG